MRKRGSDMQQMVPRPGLKPRATAARTKPLYMGGLLYQLSQTAPRDFKVLSPVQTKTTQILHMTRLHTKSVIRQLDVVSQAGGVINTTGLKPSCEVKILNSNKIFTWHFVGKFLLCHTDIMTFAPQMPGHRTTTMEERIVIVNSCAITHRLVQRQDKKWSCCGGKWATRSGYLVSHVSTA